LNHVHRATFTTKRDFAQPADNEKTALIQRTARPNTLLAIIRIFSALFTASARDRNDRHDSSTRDR
jgi:hypothetical protein